MKNEGSATERRVARERSARKQAEALLESKSRELYQTNQDLQHLTANLEKRVADRTHDLVVMKDQALAGNRAKSTFLANMSHELRTPISGIIGLAELMIEETVLTENHKLAEMIIESSEALLCIINQVLDLSKLEAEQWDREDSDFDLCKVVDEVTNTLSKQIATKHLVYGVLIDPSLTRYLHGDAGRLRQLLTNLLSNAVKFTEQGSVKLKVSRISSPEQELMVLFEVSDTGIGIREDDRSMVFQKFSQLEPGRARKNTGTGLGLSICKNMVEILGGEIGYNSSYGEGSTFWFSLPVRDSGRNPSSYAAAVTVVGLIASDEQRSIIDSQLKYLNISSNLFSSVAELRKWLDYESPPKQCNNVSLLVEQTLVPQLHDLAKLKNSNIDKLGDYRLVSICWGDAGDIQPSCSAGTSMSLPITYKKLFDLLEHDSPHDTLQFNGEKKTQPRQTNTPAGSILLVEDSPALQLATAAILKKLGFQVQLAANGRDAVEALKNTDFSLILMDIQMPEMDGLTATQLIRDLEPKLKSQIPIIALTAFAMKGDEETFLQAGMDDYLTKPIRLEALKSALKRWLPLSESIQGNSNF
jgi:signal transduction histidine kinase/CheY-like chemotaxis protein